MAAERMYTVKAIAELWICSKDHIYDLIAQGELASTQISDRRAMTRIPESALADYIQRNTTPARKVRSIRGAA